MYTNKFKGATNTSTTVVLSILVAGVHVLGYGILSADDDAPNLTAASAYVTTAPTTETSQSANVETIIVIATRLPRAAKATK